MIKLNILLILLFTLTMFSCTETEEKVAEKETEEKVTENEIEEKVVIINQKIVLQKGTIDLTKNKISIISKKLKPNKFGSVPYIFEVKDIIGKTIFQVNDTNVLLLQINTKNTNQLDYILYKKNGFTQKLYDNGLMSFITNPFNLYSVNKTKPIEYAVIGTGDPRFGAVNNLHFGLNLKNNLYISVNNKPTGDGSNPNIFNSYLSFNYTGRLKNKSITDSAIIHQSSIFQNVTAL